ncbi:MAG: Flp pilus assembly protein CpaB [Myxococcales bacterium]|nr:Flp pilus assembly protein CpaB [Myxococcales bacterium]
MARRNTGGRIRALLFLLISFGAAAVASVVIYFVITSYQRELVTAQRPDETIEVMVAAKDLGPGKTIVLDDLAMVDLPPDYVPDSVLRQPEQAVGRVPRERILASEFIREERLADPEAGLGLNAIIPRGMRALSINISDGSAVSGFLNPGNYSDVLVTIEGDDNREAETVTLLQAVTVLAVNNRVGTSIEKMDTKYKPSVTLAVTPELAEKLTHAVAQGVVTLTLRNDIDVTHVETHGAFASALLGGQDKEKRITVKEWTEKTRKSQDGTLTIIRGKGVSTEKTRQGP